MKRFIALLMVFGIGLFAVSCASTGQGFNTQKGAAIGAGLGAIAGQAIGRNTAGTLIGMAGGALAGAIIGNAVDQDEANMRAEMAQRSRMVYANPQAPANEPPPGTWVTVPGQWIGGRWVPAHRQWVPVNP